METQKAFKILVLDGGGSKGVYTIGVLKELEKKLGGDLYRHFQLIYGTSTGSIIAALIALGHSINSIENLYYKLIPKIMSGVSKSEKSRILREEADAVFGKKMFSDFKTDIGIISLNYDKQIPLIFKSNIQQAHGLKHSFEPGFGCSISEAVQSSCSAYPIFDMKTITTTNQGTITTIDGGFVANNGTFFALIDAHKAYKIEEKDIRLLNVGVGKFIEKPINWKIQFLGKLRFVKFVDKTLSANTNTTEILTKLMFTQLNLVRISETFNQPEYGTNMIETDENKLRRLSQLGRDSFAKYEKNIEELLGLN